MCTGDRGCFNVQTMRWQDAILAEGLWLYGCSVAYHS
jgi:hypothetical protein